MFQVKLKLLSPNCGLHLLLEADAVSAQSVIFKLKVESQQEFNKSKRGHICHNVYFLLTFILQQLKRI